MSEKETPEKGAEAAPEEEKATAAPEPEAEEKESGEEAAPEGGDAPEDRPKPKGVQKRIDELTWRAKEAERREARLLALLEQSQTKPQAEQVPQPQPQGKPHPAQYENHDDYIEALTDWKLAQHFAERDRRAQQEKTRQTQEQAQRTFAERQNEARSRYPDYDEVAGNPLLPVPPPVADVLKESELGPDVLYFLGQNPDKALQISQMSPTAIAREVGRIEARIEADRKAAQATAPAPKAPTAAPPPPKTLTGSAPVQKDPDKLPVEEWRDWRYSQLRKKRG